ncbi:hypothetical protein CEP51_013824 [Fusarium floridanum]|uniref:Heterokaryon incompatibility domain-containing protein n=2 Tax=Fusarium solani species complex TaxID=232080 RepID=A0A428Q4F5_9HYPO|nr:hypothetical protein CEP51_013824 [Fusarium floridanum]
MEFLKTGDLDGKHCHLQALSSSLAILGREVRASERKEHSDCTVLFPVLKAKSDDKTEGQRIAKDWQDAGCLALVKTGDHERLLGIGPRQISLSVNFSLIKSWLGHCTEHHESCKILSGGSDYVQGLRVIDCKSGNTIEAPASCNYLALSYVWGRSAQSQSPGDSGNSERSAVKFPKVVRDALEVTRSLKERYLWVDQFCIDQNDGPLKSAQIAQMHEIYSRACLTLVAAAGENSSYGLPGIGTKRRLPMQHFIIDNIVITQMRPHLSAQISRSTWAGRGWTYQEGYLSPRRLIFTDHEVAYLCNTMHCAETVKKPETLSESEKKADTTNFLDIIPSASGLHRTFDGLDNERWHQLKQKQLPNYTRRKLTESSDSVNAVFGLFRTLESSGIRHIHGTPIRRVSPLAASHWVEFCLTWHHEVVAKRCPTFPSWSWSGWVGGIRMSEPDIRDSDVREIALVKEYGDTIPLRDWFDNEMPCPNSPSTSASQVLRISATTVWVSFEEKSWVDLNEKSSTQSQVVGMSFIDGTHAVLPIREDITALPYAYMDENVSLDGGALGLILQRKCQKWRYTILLLKQNGDHYQRIGLVRVSSWNKTRAAAIGNSDPPMVYVNSEGIPVDEFTRSDETPLWLQGATEETITIS